MLEINNLSRTYLKVTVKVQRNEKPEKLIADGHLPLAYRSCSRYWMPLLVFCPSVSCNKEKTIQKEDESKKLKQQWQGKERRRKNFLD